MTAPPAARPQAPGSPFAPGAQRYDPAAYPRTPGEPPDPQPGTWGMQPDGTFKHPERTPVVDKRTWIAWPGQMTTRDTRTYAHAATLEAFHPIVVFPGQTWQAAYDVDGRRYLFVHFFAGQHKILDITDPHAVAVVKESGPDFSRGVPALGATTIRRSAATGRLTMVSGAEVPRYGHLQDKWRDPASRAKIEQWQGLRGFCVHELRSPVEWELVAEVSTDPASAPGDLVQDGSGVVDVPVWDGGAHLFTATAPDASFCNQPYRSLLYANGHVAWDMRDPAAPRRLGTWWAEGSRAGEEATSPHYRGNPRWNDHTSWLGARMGLAIPRMPEQGGRYAYAAMGGLGMFVLDVSDPSEIREVGHLPLPISVAGNEGDHVDATQAEATGFVYVNGYPMNNDGYEPEKPIFQVDVRDPANPRIVQTLPKPVPPAEAPFTDYAQRRGAAGPKRSAAFSHVGTPHPGLLPYAHHNAGVQLYDVRDPEHPVIGAAYVPPQGLSDADDISGTVHGVFVEWDRNLIWTFSSFGVHVVSSPLLGAPRAGLPTEDAR